MLAWTTIKNDFAVLRESTQSGATNDNRSSQINQNKIIQLFQAGISPTLSSPWGDDLLIVFLDGGVWLHRQTKNAWKSHLHKYLDAHKSNIYDRESRRGKHRALKFTFIQWLCYWVFFFSFFLLLCSFHCGYCFFLIYVYLSGGNIYWLKMHFMKPKRCLKWWQVWLRWTLLTQTDTCIFLVFRSVSMDNKLKTTLWKIRIKHLVLFGSCKENKVWPCCSWSILFSQLYDGQAEIKASWRNLIQFCVRDCGWHLKEAHRQIRFVCLLFRF